VIASLVLHGGPSETDTIIGLNDLLAINKMTAEINCENSTSISFYMLHDLCDIYLRHTTSVVIDQPQILNLTIRNHKSDVACYFCRRLSCCASCCPGETYRFPNMRVVIPNREIFPGSSGSIEGELNDVYCLKRGSIYDCLDVAGKLNLVRYGVQRGWLPHSFFVLLVEKHINNQKIVVDQSLDFLTNRVAEFGNYLREAFGEVSSSILRIVSDTFNLIVAGVVSSVAGLIQKTLTDQIFDQVVTLFGCAKEVVLCIISTFIRMLIGYPVEHLFLELILSCLPHLPEVVPMILGWGSSFLDRKKDGVVDQGVVEDMAAPLLSAICMIVYAAGSRKSLSVSNAVGLNRIIVGMLPRNLSDYAEYIPFVSDLVQKTTLESAMEACPGSWAIIVHNLNSHKQLNTKQLRELSYDYARCIEERKDPCLKESFGYLKRKYGEALREPEALRSSLCRKRTAPYCMCLYGSTSVGKSNQAEKLAEAALLMLALYDVDYNYLLQDLKEDLDREESEKKVKISDYVYTFTGSADHWDGYYGQPIIIISDGFASVESQTKSRMENLLRLKDTAPYLLKMAALTDKGRFAEPKLLLLTTNVRIEAWPQKLEKVANNARAYQSRIDCYVEVTPIRETEDKRLDPIPGTDIQCRYVRKLPGSKWDYKLKSNLTWGDLLADMCVGIRNVVRKKEAKQMHETKNFMRTLFENPEMDHQDIVKFFDKKEKEEEEEEEYFISEEEEDFDLSEIESYKSGDARSQIFLQNIFEGKETHNQGLTDWLIGRKGESSGLEEEDLEGSQCLREGDWSAEIEMIDQDIYIKEARKRSGRFAAFKEFFGIESDYRFFDYYELYDPTKHWSCDKIKCCEKNMCGNDPFKCPTAALACLKAGTWIGNYPSEEEIEKIGFVRRKRIEPVIKGICAVASIALVAIGYLYYREKTNKTIQNMDNVLHLKVGDRTFDRVNVDSSEGRKYVYVESKFVKEFETGAAQKKRDIEEVKEVYLPPRVYDKLSKIQKSVIEVQFGNDLKQRCLAVGGSRFLALGHYVRNVNSLPNMVVHYGRSVISLDCRNVTGVYYKDTDLLVISIVSGPRLPCPNITRYFREDMPRKGFMVRRMDLQEFAVAAPISRVMVSGSIREGLYGVKGSNAAGDCGLPYLFTEDNDACLAGIHSAGDNGEICYFIPITRGILSDGVNQGILLPAPVVVGESRQDFVGEFDEFVPLGRSSFQCILPKNNAHERIPCLHKDKGKLWKKKYDLCKLNKFIKEGVEYSPAKIRLKKLTKGLKFKEENLPQPLEDKIVNTIAAAIRTLMTRNLPYKPDYNFLIEDHEEYKWTGMDVSKSAGPMIGGVKRNLVDEAGMLEDWVIEVLKIIEESIVERREYPAIVRGYTIKDEKLPMDKVESGTSRLFAPDDALFYLLCKKFFFRLVVFVNMHGSKIGIMTGMTPEELGVEFIRIFTRGEGEGVDVDVSGMECGHSDQSILLIMRLMIMCGFVDNSRGVYEVHPSLPLLSADALICWVLLNITLFGYCVIADQTFTFRDGALGSGSLLTFILNCFMLLYIVGKRYMKLGKYPEFHDLMIEGRPDWMLFGDDSVVLGSADCIIESYRDMGFEATGADKGELKSKEFRQLTFCGRTYTYNHITGATMKLELDRIIKGVQFTKRSQFLEIYPNQVYSFLFELARHSAEVWREVLAQFEIKGFYLRDYLSSQEDYLRCIRDQDSLYEEVLRWIVAIANSGCDVFSE